MPLTKVGRYEIKEELGRGAMGVVYRGFDPTIGRTVAIKTILLDSGDPEMVKRFRREARAAGILSHPNIVTIYDAGEDQGLFYIAMELVEGETLHKMLTQGPLPFQQAVSILEQVGAALDHAHQREIIHRDVKPANIVISNGVAKVMDFGVAKITSAGMTSTGQVLGTPSYMSPEVVKGQPIDGRSDIFSLGVVLYEMLTANKPFVGDNITTVIYKIVGEQPEPPAAINPSLDPGLNYVVLKALAKLPAERYQTCTELVADLKNFRARTSQGKVMSRAAGAASASAAEAHTVVLDRKEFKVAESPATGAGEAGAPGRVRKGAWAAAALALLAVIGGGLWKLRQPSPGPGPESERIVVPSPATVPAPPPRSGGAAPPAAGEQPSAPAAAQQAPPAPAAKEAAQKTKPAGAALAPQVEFQISASMNPAVIHVDGKSAPDWVTPHRFKLPAGRHTIEVRRDGYQPQKREVEFTRNGPRSLMFELAPLQALVEISTTPPGAEVLVDGRVQGQTPSRFAFVYGEHRVALRKQGYRTAERAVNIGPSAPPQIYVALVPEKSVAQAPPETPAPVPAGGFGRISVRTLPRGASIIVDGSPTQYHTPVNFALPAGKHKVTIEHPGFESETREINLRKNQMADLEIALKPAGQKRRRFPFR